ncbi:hypothetical protein BC830DRAFT_1176075 [Chytriomyces sp. MP71]|nr:hypothetical protein BC830DRAFT_1176075 [Chytriomyces sp. MP71]
MLKEYTIKRKEKLFRRPRYRQFFLGPILHRSTEEMKTSWTEIFVDLLYVGVLAKAGELVRGDQSWDAFSKFCLVVIPCLAHWNAYTLYNNQIHHEDLYAKVLVNVIMISIMVMGNSLKNAFNPVPELNTSTIFIISYICERLFIIGSQVVVTAYFHSEFWLFNGLQAITRFAIMIPYFVLLGLPVNGDPARETVRLSIWYVGAAMELFLPLLGIATFRIVMMFVSVDDRPAVSECNSLDSTP